MNGTEWTEPGQGATVEELEAARKRAGSQKGGRHLNSLIESHSRTHRTNLRLTGAPLTAEDLERIAKCK